jgi:hypothetical protein
VSGCMQVEGLCRKLIITGAATCANGLTGAMKLLGG